MSTYNITAENLKKIPKEPGVYTFLDKDGDVLYIGKAKNLKNRVKQYFQKNLDRGPAMEVMVEKAKRIKLYETESEIEALLLEAELINKIQPKYNVREKDDKSFMLIHIEKVDFPCVRLVRSKDVRDLGNKLKKREYFGPYTQGLALKNSIKYLRRIFNFCDCSKAKFNTYKKRERTCLYGDIGLCSGACVGKIYKEDYQKSIELLKEFLRGGKKKVIKILEIEMHNASKNKEFEKAAEFRNKVESLSHIHEVAVGIRDKFFESSKILFKRIECFDISNIQGEFSVGGMSVVKNGQKSTSDYRKFKIKTVKGANDLAMTKEILHRRFHNSWPMPDLLVIDGGRTHLNIVLKVLKENKLEIPAMSIAKGIKRDKNEFHFASSDLTKYFKKSPELSKMVVVARNEAHRFAVKYYRLLHSKSLIDS